MVPAPLKSPDVMKSIHKVSFMARISQKDNQDSDYCPLTLEFT